MTIDTGVPAFPTTGVEFSHNGVNMAKQGMTLRDYFAAFAMQGQIGNSLYIGDEPSRKIMAKRAYWMADALMEARNG